MDVREFDYKSVGLKIKHALLDADLSQTELAEKMGITRQGLYLKISNNTWTVSDVRKVAEILNIDAKDLI
jgi:transcriptional regulator with XRE-family HTH domain